MQRTTAGGEGNWVGRSVSQETISASFNLTGIYCIFFLAYCIKTDWWQKWEAWWQQFPLKTVKVEEKVCFLKKRGEKPETEL